MKEFKYVIKDEQGIHARPAGMFVKEAAAFSSKVVKMAKKWMLKESLVLWDLA